MMGVYRLFNAKQVYARSGFRSHRQRTIEAIAAHQGVVLLIHDSEELNYTHCKALSQEAGQIGSGHGWGFIAHHSLAVTPQGQVLGLVNQISTLAAAHEETLKADRNAKRKR